MTLDRNISLQLSVFIAVLILLVSCTATESLSGKRDGSIEQSSLDPQPSWINQRPINPAYYIGIGSASKIREPLDYQQVAKKNALNDLSSEIRVTVKGETFLNTLERDYKFQEEFRAQIKTSVSEDIEDFEIVDSWEDKNTYYVYYRLSRAEHARRKKQKKDAALNAAHDLYRKGQDAIENGNVSGGFDLHMRALLEMKEYWDEVNEYLTDEGLIYLDNTIYGEIREIATNIQLSSEVPGITLSVDNEFSSKVDIQATYKNIEVKNIPVNYHYNKRKYSRPKSLNTSDRGIVSIPINEVNLEKNDSYLEAWINIQDLIAKDLDDDLTEELLKGIPERKINLSIEIRYPLVYIQSVEKIYGESSPAPRLKNGLANALSKSGFQMVDEANRADYLVDINGITTQGGTSQGFHVAFLDLSIVVKDQKSGNEIYNQAYNKLKGLQLNFDAAAVEAMKKGAEKLEKESSKDLINRIL